MYTPPPDKENFEKLLAYLNDDRERAGEVYEFLRLKLIHYFWARSCSPPEELADETLNRLAKKVAEGEEIRHVGQYCHGLANFVRKEHLRKLKTAPVPLDDSPEQSFSPPDPLIRKQREACARHCLQAITEIERRLIIEYWDHENRPHNQARRELAERWQLSLTAIRIRVSRTKDKLKSCYAKCLEKGPQKVK